MVKIHYELPRHSLDKALPEMIVGNGHLHLLVSHVGITMAQKHNLFRLNIIFNQYYCRVV